MSKPLLQISSSPFTFASSALNPACINVCRILNRLWVYLNFRRSASQYSEDITTLMPVFRKMQKAETISGAIFWGKKITDGPQQRKDWDEGHGFKVITCLPLPSSSHAHGAGGNCAADTPNWLHLQHLPEVSFEKGGSETISVPAKGLEAELFKKGEGRGSHFFPMWG